MENNPPTPDPDPGEEKTSVPREFAKSMAEWFFEIFDLESVGGDMMTVAQKHKHRGKILRLVAVTFILFGGIGFWIHGCYDNLRGVDADNYELRTALETNQAALNTERGENDKLTHQHIDDQSLLEGLRNYSAGLPHKETPAELMGFHDQTNYIELTNFTSRAISSAMLTNGVKFDSDSRDKMPIDALALNAPVPGYYYLEASFNVSNNVPYAPYKTSFNFSPGMIDEYGPITVIDEQNKTNTSQSEAAGNWSDSGNSTAVHSIHEYSLHLNVASSNTIIRPFLQKMPFNGQIISLAPGSYVQLTKLPSITDADARQAGK
jgi:hypothetical protein